MRHPAGLIGKKEGESGHELQEEEKRKKPEGKAVSQGRQASRWTDGPMEKEEEEEEERWSRADLIPMAAEEVVGRARKTTRIKFFEFLVHGLSWLQMC